MSMSHLSPPSANTGTATARASRNAPKEDARDTEDSTDFTLGGAYPKPAALASAPGPHAAQRLVQSLDARRPWMSVARHQRLDQCQGRRVLLLCHQRLGLEELQGHGFIGIRQAPLHHGRE